MTQAPRLLVCGEALLDVFLGEETHAGIAMEGQLGGSPFNVAVGLARLAQSVAFFGGISTDAVGRRLFTALNAEGVDTSAVVRSKAASTLSVVGAGRDGAPGYTFYGASSADTQVGVEMLDQVPRHFQAIALGSFACVAEPVGLALRQLVERERDRSLIAWDPNVRLQAVPSVDRWRQLATWMFSRAHMIKLSVEDLVHLAPNDEAQAFARRALSQGCKLVVVTAAERGLTGYTAHHTVHMAAAPATVVDTVGAGDSTQAALLSWLAERGALTPMALGALSAADLESALGYAARAAAITVGRRGADLPRRAELLG